MIKDLSLLISHFPECSPYLARTKPEQKKSPFEHRGRKDFTTLEKDAGSPATHFNPFRMTSYLKPALKNQYLSPFEYLFIMFTPCFSLESSEHITADLKMRLL